MGKNGARPLLLGTVLLWTGCHVLLPLSGGEGRTDTKDGLVHLDVIGVDGDHGDADASLAVDGPRPLDGRADGVPDLGCVVPPTLAVGGPCNQQCLSPGGDLDCDGLPDGRDPWPGCNLALLAEDFDTSAAARWQGATAPTWGCGEVTLDDGLLRLTSSGQLGASPSYLTETWFTVEQISAPAKWSVGLGTAINGKQERRCELFVDQSTLPVPTARVLVNGGAGGSVAIIDLGSPLTVTAGSQFLLQTWTEGDEHFCRLLDPTTGAALHQVSLSTFLLTPSSSATGVACGSGACPPFIGTCVVDGGVQKCSVTITLTSGGTVELRAVGARATFRYVRAFKHP